MSEGELKETAASRAEEFRSEFQPLIDELYREEVLEARRMPLEEKLLLLAFPHNIGLAGGASDNNTLDHDKTSVIFILTCL